MKEILISVYLKVSEPHNHKVTRRFTTLYSNRAINFDESYFLARRKDELPRTAPAHNNITCYDNKNPINI